jgi:DNA-binding response OmpR family regulator
MWILKAEGDNMKILVVDDEQSILDLVRMSLILENYDVITLDSGKDFSSVIEHENPDFIILDVMLGIYDGLNLLKELRSSGVDTPVILLTAKSQINDRLMGLYCGADDYISKPFDSRELILRIKAIEKRMDRNHSQKSCVLSSGFLRMDQSARKAFIDGSEVYLTKKEFDVLFLLVKNNGTVFRREELLTQVWGYDSSIDTRALDALIQRIRKKLGIHGESIVTLYGIGYKFEVQ